LDYTTLLDIFLKSEYFSRNSSDALEPCETLADPSQQETGFLFFFWGEYLTTLCVLEIYRLGVEGE
jgi:hypothetical protein